MFHSLSEDLVEPIPLVKFLVQEGSDLRLPDLAELTGGEVALISLLLQHLYSPISGLVANLVGVVGIT